MRYPQRCDTQSRPGVAEADTTRACQLRNAVRADTLGKWWSPICKELNIQGILPRAYTAVTKEYPRFLKMKGDMFKITREAHGTPFPLLFLPLGFSSHLGKRKEEEECINSSHIFFFSLKSCGRIAQCLYGAGYGGATTKLVPREAVVWHSLFPVILTTLRARTLHYLPLCLAWSRHTVGVLWMAGESSLELSLPWEPLAVRPPSPVSRSCPWLSLFLGLWLIFPRPRPCHSPRTSLLAQILGIWPAAFLFRDIAGLHYCGHAATEQSPLSPQENRCPSSPHLQALSTPANRRHVSKHLKKSYHQDKRDFPYSRNLPKGIKSQRNACASTKGFSWTSTIHRGLKHENVTWPFLL